MTAPTTSAVRYRPILFSGEMVRAILSGTKTQTRRVVTPQPEYIGDEFIKPDPSDAAQWISGNRYEVSGEIPLHDEPCPYGASGDRLYVKEASWIWCRKVPNGTTPTGRAKWLYVPEGRHVVYCTDGKKPTEPISNDPDCLWRWKAARFMPRWASRITLEITDVRVERVREITSADAIAEGIRPYANSFTIDCDTPDPRDDFAQLWDSINAGRGYGWDVNPWVWCISFRRVES